MVSSEIPRRSRYDPAMRILVVDDDPAVLSGLRRALVLEGHEVATATDGEETLALVSEAGPDLIVLDVMLPGLDGFTVCERIRRRLGASVPILLLSARDAVPDRVTGLDKGADDYLVKPFSIDELLARTRALLRRTQSTDEAVLVYSDVRLNLSSREAFRGEQTLSLTAREFDLLETFLKHPRQVLTRQQLCHQVWGYAFEGESNFIDVAVMELRKKLESGNQSRLIQTVRSHGYILKEE
jgi:DNA-binding response OmpR family regulator